MPVVRILLGMAVFCMLAVTAGCDQVPDPAFASLEGSLRLRIVRITPSRAAETRFDLELKNRSARRARACIGPGRRVTGLAAMGFQWDHPGCVREFELDPGGVLTWSETHDGTVGPGLPLDVAVAVQVLNPRRCSSVGCAGFMVESPPLTTSK